jgi:hypothetical protein
MRLSLPELKKRLDDLISSIDPTEYSGLTAKILDFYKYSIENYGSLDDEAKRYVDRLTEDLKGEIRTGIEALPEGPQKRQALRQLGIAERRHFRAEDLLELLQSPPRRQEPVLANARATFVQIVQYILDVLFDVTRHTHRGPANFSKIGLCYWAVDELIVSMHLAQRAFTTQAYAHIRTVFEILDLMELFHVQPEWADLWASGDDRKILSELNPSEVRKKLGRPKFDPTYSLFSQLGTHATFKGLQARAAKVADPDKKDPKRFRLWVGGSPPLRHIVWTNSYCIHAAYATLVKSVGMFLPYLNGSEMRKVIEAAGEHHAEFDRKHIVGWAKEAGINPQPLLDLLEKAPWKLSNIKGIRHET